MVDPVTPDSVAAMVVVPLESAEARPEALTVATAGEEDDQLTWLVRSRTLPSE